MPKRKIFVLQSDDRWNQFLIEAFEDTPSTPEILRTSEEALPKIRQEKPDAVFANPELITRPLGAALRMHKTSNGSFRMFQLGLSGGKEKSSISDLFDDAFPGAPPSLHEFQKKLSQHLPLPDPLRILVVDEKPEVIERFREFLDRRRGPAFVVEGARDTREAVKRLEKESLHVLVLDPKIAGEDGREFYRELKEEGKLPPTLLFFEALSAERVLEIRRWGKAALVEKGSPSSALPEMTTLIQKIAYFG